VKRKQQPLTMTVQMTAAHAWFQYCR